MVPVVASDATESTATDPAAVPVLVSVRTKSMVFVPNLSAAFLSATTLAFTTGTGPDAAAAGAAVARTMTGTDHAAPSATVRRLTSDVPLPLTFPCCSIETPLPSPAARFDVALNVKDRAG